MFIDQLQCKNKTKNNFTFVGMKECRLISTLILQEGMSGFMNKKCKISESGEIEKHLE